MMLAPIRDISMFFHGLRTQLKFGRLARTPLRLLRFEWKGGVAECELLARPADEWDRDLRPRVVGVNTSVQALEDALAVRDLLFCTLPGLSTAALRLYRQSENEPPELIIAGTLDRNERAPGHVRSLPMRAKLCGFRFWLEDGRLGALQLDRGPCPS